jgi:hypothetical protein
MRMGREKDKMPSSKPAIIGMEKMNGPRLVR